MRTPRVSGRSVGGQAKAPVPLVVSLDGRSFPKPLSDQIDRLCHLTFNSADGQQLLVWLESVTLRTVLPPEASNETLRELEGQRRLVAMLRQRMRRAVKPE